MKKIFFVILVTYSAISCISASEKHETEKHESSSYACPMKCEENKTYKEKGTCPVCKMDLEKI
jgi:protein SCO1